MGGRRGRRPKATARVSPAAEPQPVGGGALPRRAGETKARVGVDEEPAGSVARGAGSRTGDPADDLLVSKLVESYVRGDEHGKMPSMTASPDEMGRRLGAGITSAEPEHKAWIRNLAQCSAETGEVWLDGEFIPTENFKHALAWALRITAARGTSRSRLVSEIVRGAHQLLGINLVACRGNEVVESTAFHGEETTNKDKAGEGDELSRNRKKVTAEQRVSPSEGGAPPITKRGGEDALPSKDKGTAALQRASPSEGGAPAGRSASQPEASENKNLESATEKVDVTAEPESAEGRGRATDARTPIAIPIVKDDDVPSGEWMTAVRALADRAAAFGHPDDWLALQGARDSTAGKARKFAREVFRDARRRLEAERARRKAAKAAARAKAEAEKAKAKEAAEAKVQTDDSARAMAAKTEAGLSPDSGYPTSEAALEKLVEVLAVQYEDGHWVAVHAEATGGQVRRDLRAGLSAASESQRNEIVRVVRQLGRTGDRKLWAALQWALHEFADARMMGDERFAGAFLQAILARWARNRKMDCCSPAALAADEAAEAAAKLMGSSAARTEPMVAEAEATATGRARETAKAKAAGAEAEAPAARNATAETAAEARRKAETAAAAAVAEAKAKTAVRAKEAKSKARAAEAAARAAAATRKAQAKADAAAARRAEAEVAVRARAAQAEAMRKAEAAAAAASASAKTNTEGKAAEARADEVAADAAKQTETATTARAEAAERAKAETAARAKAGAATAKTASHAKPVAAAAKADAEAAEKTTTAARTEAAAQAKAGAEAATRVKAELEAAKKAATAAKAKAEPSSESGQEVRNAAESAVVRSGAKATATETGEEMPTSGAKVSTAAKTETEARAKTVVGRPEEAAVVETEADASAKLGNAASAKTAVVETGARMAVAETKAVARTETMGEAGAETVLAESDTEVVEAEDAVKMPEAALEAGTEVVASSTPASEARARREARVRAKHQRRKERRWQRASAKALLQRTLDALCEENAVGAVGRPPGARPEVGPADKTVVKSAGKMHGSECRNEIKGAISLGEARGSAHAETHVEEGGGMLKAGRPPDWLDPGEMVLEKGDARGSARAEVHDEGGGASTDDGSPGWSKPEPGIEGPEPEAEPPDPAPDIQKADEATAGDEPPTEERTRAAVFNFPASEAGAGAVATSSPASEVRQRRGAAEAEAEPPDPAPNESGAWENSRSLRGSGGTASAARAASSCRVGVPVAEAKPPDPGTGEPELGMARGSACREEAECRNGGVAFNMPAPEAGAEAVIVRAPAPETRGCRGVPKAEKEPPDRGRGGPEIDIAGRSRVGLKAHDPGGGGRTHGSARAERSVGEVGAAVDSGGPPGWHGKSPEREEFGKAHGSASAEPWPGWGRELMKEKAKGGEPPDKPSKGWANARSELEADLEAANQAVTRTLGLLHRDSDEVAHLRVSACAWKTTSHPHARECVGHPRPLAPAAWELASSAGVANEGCPEEGPAGGPTFPPGCNSGEKWPTDDGQTGAIWAPEEQAKERELAMAGGDLLLALAWGLVCWGFARDLASCAECGAWARPVGEVAGRLVAQEGEELTWRGGTSPGGDVRGDEGEALASAGE